MTGGPLERNGDRLEWTLVLLKPDCLRRGLVPRVLGTLSLHAELVDARLVLPTRRQVLETWERLVWREGRERADGVEFARRLLGMFAGRPMVAAVLRGPDAIVAVREAVGASDPVLAAPGTIRGDLGRDSYATARSERRLVWNLVHASKTSREVEREIAIWFDDEPRRHLGLDERRRSLDRLLADVAPYATERDPGPTSAAVSDADQAMA